MTIEEVIKARIIALNTMAAGRVYRERIEQEPIMPAIAISRNGPATGARDASGSPLMKRAQITVAIVAFSMADAIAVAVVLAPDPNTNSPAGLDGWTTQDEPPVAGVPVVNCCKLLSQQEASEIEGDSRLRVILQDYEIKFR